VTLPKSIISKEGFPGPIGVVQSDWSSSMLDETAMMFTWLGWVRLKREAAKTVVTRRREIRRIALNLEILKKGFRTNDFLSCMNNANWEKYVAVFPDNEAVLPANHLMDASY
jgi:hypothetical protein